MSPGGTSTASKPARSSGEHLVAASTTSTSAIASLPGGHVGQQLQHRLERDPRGRPPDAARAGRSPGRAPRAPSSSSSSSRTSTTVSSSSERRPRRRAGSRPRPRRAAARRPTPEQRQRRRVADAVDRPVDRQRLRALVLGRPRACRVVDADDDRDPVTFRDLAGSDVVRLPPAAAEPSRSSGCACRPARRRSGARRRRAPSRRRRRAARARRARAGPSPRRG